VEEYEYDDSDVRKAELLEGSCVRELAAAARAAGTALADAATALGSFSSCRLVG